MRRQGTLRDKGASKRSANVQGLVATVDSPVRSMGGCGPLTFLRSGPDDEDGPVQAVLASLLRRDEGTRSGRSHPPHCERGDAAGLAHVSALGLG